MRSAVSITLLMMLMTGREPNTTPSMPLLTSQAILLPDHVIGELQEHHQVYVYAYYNDLGAPDYGKPRSALGGTKKYPYTRRGRTGCPSTISDPHSESRLTSLTSLNIYVPRNKRFGHIKMSDFNIYAPRDKQFGYIMMSDFIGYSLKSLVQGALPALEGLLTNKDFITF